MIKLFKPYMSEQAIENMVRVARSGQLAEGPEVKLFEQEFADKFGFEAWQIVTLNSGTAAIELAYELVGVEGGDVISPILTCTATNIPLVRKNVHIIFADIEGKTTLNADPEDVRNKRDEATRALVFVHFGGSSEGLGEFEEIADEYDIDLICDAAQAVGSHISKKARFSCVSLQAIKSLTAGDGGILICRDPEDAIKARKLRWFGYDRELKQREGDCDLEIAGYKMHMNDLSASIARGNLADWDVILEHRNDINDAYEERGQGRGFVRGIWNPQVIGLPYPTLKAELLKIGVEIGQYHYRNDKYSIFKRAENDCPTMDRLNDLYFMLPCHMGMTVADAEEIAKIIWP